MLSRRSTRRGIRTSTIQAPRANLVTPTTTATTPVARAPRALIGDAPAPARLAQAPVVAHHPGLGEGEGHEDAHGVEGDQVGHAAPEDHHQPGGDGGQEDDARGEGQAVAPEGELVGQEAVAGHQAGQAGEVGEGGVRRQDQQDGGGELDQVVVGAPADQGAGHLAEHRLHLGRVGDDAQLGGQEGDPQEDGGEEGGHPDQGDAGVLALRGLEGGDPVGDGLHPGEGDGPGGEGAQDAGTAPGPAPRRGPPPPGARTRAASRWPSAGGRRGAARRSPNR